MAAPAMQQIEPVMGEKKLACAGSVGVGREPPAALVLSGDTTVSRRHARIDIAPSHPERCAPPTITLFDESSKYGTFASTTSTYERVAPGRPVSLSHGDSFTVGKRTVCVRVTLQEIVLCCNTSVPSSNVVHNAKHICAGICSQWHSAPSSITHALVQHDLEAVSPIIVLAMIENKPVVDTNWIHAAAENDIASSDSSCLHHPSCSFRITIAPSVAKKPSELTAHANPDEGDGNETGDDEDDHAERAEHKNEHEADQSGEQPLVALDRDTKLAFEKLGGYVVQTDSVDFNRHRWDDYSVALVDEKRVEDLERFKTPSAPNAPANHLTSVHRVFAAALLGDSSNLFVTQKPEQQQRSTVRKRAREPSAEGSEGEIEDREVNHLKKRCQKEALEQCDAAQETPEPSGNQEQQQHQQEDGGHDEGDNEDERDMQIVENEGEIGNAGVDIDEDGWVDISHRVVLPSKHPEGNAKAVEVDQEDIEERDQRAESQEEEERSAGVKRFTKCQRVSTEGEVVGDRELELVAIDVRERAGKHDGGSDEAKRAKMLDEVMKRDADVSTRKPASAKAMRSRVGR